MLCDPNHFGTLAAARDLGRLGAHVAVVEDGRGPTLAGASRWCRERLVAPDPRNAAAFLAWLINYGDAAPGTLLYPTSDEAAWLIAAHRGALAERFALFQPMLPALLALMDKTRLYALAGQLGIDVPATSAPTSDAAVLALGHDLERSGGYPVIVKPRTQACMAVKLKGEIAHSTAALQAAVAVLRRASYATTELWPGAGAEMRWPLVQAYRPEAQHDTYSMAGFADASSRIRAVRASSKVFQIPVRIGVGVAFEDRPVLAAQLTQLQALVTAAGYFGAFEAEFINVADQGRYLLMDFNPRIYGQMQFDVARGMHLPRMLHAAAMGDDGALDALAVEAASERPRGPGRHYCDRWMFRLLLRTQRLSGRLSPSEHARWRAWTAGPELVDAVDDPDDTAPQAVRRRTFARQFLRHPRASLRTLFG